MGEGMGLHVPRTIPVTQEEVSGAVLLRDKQRRAFEFSDFPDEGAVTAEARNTQAQLERDNASQGEGKDDGSKQQLLAE